MSSAPSLSESLLDGLNEAQRAAVTHEDRHLLIVAGAGTGKTRALTRRVGWLVAQGISPWSVLAITFTNKAARVLKERIGSLPGSDGVWAGTFHSFGAFLLRRHGETIGLDPRFTILDRDDQTRLVKSILSDAHLPRELSPRDLLAAIGHEKNGGGAPLPRLVRAKLARIPLPPLLMEYTARLRAGHMLDFDDLLLEPVRLLREVDDVRALYHDRFRHILVDEYQDTNLIQRDLLLLLAGTDGVVTAVGDPDQSIYRWRGAEVRNILEFDQDFPGAHRVVLERNYRSTKTILEAAESVIENNVDRHAKRLFTENADGQAVRVLRALDAGREGAAIADEIQRWIRQGYRPSDVAVFYRVNAASRAIETALRARDIPYVVVASVEFFQRREVKDLLAYARLIENPHDEAAFRRVVNVPRRGVGATSLERLQAGATQSGLSLYEVARRGDDRIKGVARKGLARFLGLLERVRADADGPVADVLLRILEETEYREQLASSPDELERARVENVEELVAFARQFDREEGEVERDEQTDPARGGEGTGLSAFLERTALVSDQDDVDPTAGRVSLMSVHAAKGLEFPCVVIAGAENGSFPHARSLDEDGRPEEERRLFYVAMTRAEQHLTVTCAQGRHSYRGFERRHPSPYLREIPTSLLACVDLVADTDFLAGTDIGWQVRELSGRVQAPDPHEQDAPVREVEGGFTIGDRVRHPYFGEGRLFEVEGRGRTTYLTVDFDGVGRKRMLMHLARLEKAT